MSNETNVIAHWIWLWGSHGQQPGTVQGAPHQENHAWLLLILSLTKCEIIQESINLAAPGSLSENEDNGAIGQGCHEALFRDDIQILC